MAATTGGLSPPEAIALEAGGISVRFGGLLALDNIDFSVRTGQIKGLIGPNGAGKSTFFNVLTGIIANHQGEVRLDDQRIDRIAPFRRVERGMVRTFQKVHPFRGMTVLESAMVACHTRSEAGMLAAMLCLPSTLREEREIRVAAQTALGLVGLKEYAETQADALPLGRQRLLQLACAIASQPRVILLDEPASGLNTSETAHLGRLLLGIRARGITLVLVEHDMSLVMKICDEITVLSFGKKLAEGTPAEIRRNPEVVRAYLGGGRKNA
jgi:branched-chain amino acid transport system ATP-binding protein